MTSMVSTCARPSRTSSRLAALPRSAVSAFRCSAAIRYSPRSFDRIHSPVPGSSAASVQCRCRVRVGTGHPPGAKNPGSRSSRNSSMPSAAARTSSPERPTVATSASQRWAIVSCIIRRDHTHVRCSSRKGCQVAASGRVVARMLTRMPDPRRIQAASSSPVASGDGCDATSCGGAEAVRIACVAHRWTNPTCTPSWRRSHPGQDGMGVDRSAASRHVAIRSASLRMAMKRSSSPIRLVARAFTLSTVTFSP